MGTTDTVDLRRMLLIYCLVRLADGSYIALNRDYKPLGQIGSAWVEYETAPGRFQFKRALTADQISALSYKGDPEPERIYLYNDGTEPTASDANWAAYSERLQRLMGHKAVHA